MSVPISQHSSCYKNLQESSHWAQGVEPQLKHVEGLKIGTIIKIDEWKKFPSNELLCRICDIEKKGKSGMSQRSTVLIVKQLIKVLWIGLLNTIQYLQDPFYEGCKRINCISIMWMFNLGLYWQDDKLLDVGMLGKKSSEHI